MFHFNDAKTTTRVFLSFVFQSTHALTFYQCHAPLVYFECCVGSYSIAYFDVVTCRQSLRTQEVVSIQKRDGRHFQQCAWLASKEILDIAEAAISAILAACRDFWQMPRFRNAAVNLCDCPRISDYTHQLIYTLLHIDWKWLNNRMSYMLKCLHLRRDRRTVTLSS